ncbi:MAG: hypothetical protein P8Y00_05235 [Deltaproteobacteria bacterium]
MSTMEQERGRADIRSELSKGGRSERSRGNMPVACLSSQGDIMMPPALREEIHTPKLQLGLELRAGFLTIWLDFEGKILYKKGI